MKARDRNTRVQFVVIYDDGTREPISITEGMLMTGETPFSMAERRQKAGAIPPGDIAIVLRA